MQVDFTPEQEARLSQIADHNGVNANALVQQAALRILKEDDEFREGVQRGIADANCGNFVESAEVWTKLQAILKG